MATNTNIPGQTPPTLESPVITVEEDQIILQTTTLELEPPTKDYRSELLQAKDEVILGLHTLLAEKDTSIKRLYIEIENLRAGLKSKEDELCKCDVERRKQMERLEVLQSELTKKDNNADDTKHLHEEKIEGLKERIRAQRTVLQSAKVQIDTLEAEKVELKTALEDKDKDADALKHQYRKEVEGLKQQIQNQSSALTDTKARLDEAEVCIREQEASLRRLQAIEPKKENAAYDESMDDESGIDSSVSTPLKSRPVALGKRKAMVDDPQDYSDSDRKPGPSRKRNSEWSTGGGVDASGDVVVAALDNLRKKFLTDFRGELEDIIGTSAKDDQDLEWADSDEEESRGRSKKHRKANANGVDMAGASRKKVSLRR